jgi:hypothetical protein
MAGNSEWNKAVKLAFKTGRRTNKNFSLKDAMFAAKKIYKKGKSVLSKPSRKTKKNNTRRMRGGSEHTQPPMVAAHTPSSALQFSNVAAK